MKNIPYIYLNRIMIKTLPIFMALLISVSPGYSQAPFPQPEEVEGFYSTQTLIVLEDNMFSAYNALIKDVAAEYWEITPYDFISSAEFEQKRKNPSSLILLKLLSVIGKLLGLQSGK